MRQSKIFILSIFILCVFSLPSSAAIGIFNWRIQTTDGTPPATIHYRLNCPGTVSIQILDENDTPVCSLGPWNESSGPHSHFWDGTGVVGQLHSYRARITATAQQMGTPGTLCRLTGETAISYIYGVAVDKCPASPGYGTIYVSRTIPGGAILAYYPDGTPKNDFGPDPNTNILNLGFDGIAGAAPWGIGVDELGNIYTACRSAGSVSGAKIFDYRGNQLFHVFPAEPQGNFWLDGSFSGGKPWIYETAGSAVRRASPESTAWEQVASFPPGMAAKQISFEPGGQAFYVATCGYNASVTNRGIWRFVKQAQDSWTLDASFDPGLSKMVFNGQQASWYATGVSCDAVDPDGAGPRTCSRLWIGLDVSSAYYGGNVARKTLPGGALDIFSGPGKVSRIVAADAVGNVVLEYDITDSINIWKNWGLYAPAGESSSDTRTTTPVTFSGAQAVIRVDSIAALHRLSDDSRIEFTSSKTVSAVFSDCFYLAEADHAGAIRVEGSAAVTEGMKVKLRGTLDTRNGERLLKDAEIVP